MSKFEKLLRKIRNNPKQVSFDDLDKLLRQSGFIRRQANKGSSHYSYTYPGLPPLTVPYRRPHVKEIYVKDAIKAIEESGLDFRADEQELK